MKNTLGILGYLVLIISGVYLDAPVIALLAMPLFLVGFVLILIFYLGIIKEQKSKKLLSTIFIVTGTILLCGILGYSAVEYNQYQVQVDRGTVENVFHAYWLKIILVVALNILASFLVYTGIKNSTYIKDSKLLLAWLPTLIPVPATLLLTKLAVLLGFWFGG